MRWYAGDIAQAVSMSKSKNAIFVVYVEGKDDKSTNLTSIINDSDVSSKLESDTFVAIKLEAGSVPHNQFAAIYKNVPVPSLYFIGKNGKPIDIVVDSLSANDLSSRINSVIETHTGISSTASKVETTSSKAEVKHTASKTEATSSKAEVATAAQQSASTKPSEDFLKTEQQAAAPVPEKSEIPDNVKCENGVCHIVTDPLATNTSTNNEPKPASTSATAAENFLEEEKKELTKEEKLERAKELVDLKRETKKKEEEEISKQKELERRKAGQDVQKLRQWQKDQELKTFMEEHQRAKNEEKAARDRILAQIAQDKADRASRFGTSPPTSTSTQPKPEVTQRPVANSNIARLQFKLPDGSSRTQTFESTDTLQEVRNFVSMNLNLPFKNFSLCTTYPRREFTSGDLEETLRDLELCPNAVILVLPAATASAVVASQGGGFMSLIWFLLSPILGFFGYFRNMIFGQPEDNPPQPPERNKRNNGDILEQSQQPAKRKATESTVVRRQGNIHRLSDRSDSDEDNNTWNGNSTQQM